MISTKFRFVKFVFSKKATKIDDSSIFVAFFETINFNYTRKTDISSSKERNIRQNFALWSYVW